MKINIIKINFTILLLIAGSFPAWAINSVTSNSMDIKQEKTDSDNGQISFTLTDIEISGGISAGYFYASNPGEDTEEDAFLLSNFLMEISSKDENLPLGFVAAFGETSTPTILCTPENNTDLQIEYASLILKSATDFSLEVGLLQPNAGLENTYTYDNKNVILGAVASQQPYNAYGARVAKDIKGVSLWGGYFKERLDDEEYNAPDSAWEIGLSGSIHDNTISLYHYNIRGQSNLTGAIIECTINDIDVAVIIDYWRWDSDVKNVYESGSSIGGAVYICPYFGNFSIPLRLEYIDQKNSQIYIESPDTEDIYSATVSPTWHYNESTYIRAEASYVMADDGFADDEGSTKNDRVNLALELGFTF